jgi:GAF domain-containing protein
MRKILFVEDKPEEMSYLVEDLEDLDYRIEIEKNPDQAIEKITNNINCDVVIMDQIFPGTDTTGIDIAKKIQEKNLKICSILITGKAQENKKIYELLDENIISTFFEKPVTAHEISFVIDKYFEELEYKKKFSLIQEVGVKSTQMFNIEEVLGYLIEQIHNIMDWDVCSIISRDGRELSIKKQIKFPDDMVKEFKLTVDEGLVGYAVKNNEVLIIDDLSKGYELPNGNLIYLKYEKYFIQEKEEDSYYSMLIVPIEYKETTIGAITAHKKQKSVFTQSDRQLMKILASQAANAIKNAEYFDTIIKAFNDIGREINSADDEEKAMEVIVEKAKQILNSKRGCILLYSSDDECLKCKSINCEIKKNGLECPQNSVYPTKDNNTDIKNKEALVLEVFHSGEGKYVELNDQYYNSSLKYPNELEPTFYQIAVPLYDENKEDVIGVISLERIDKDTPYNEEDLKIFEALSNFIVTVINRIKLEEKEEREKQILSTLAYVSEKIQNEQNLLIMLYKILKGITIQEGLRFNRAAFFMYDRKKHVFNGFIGVGEMEKEEAENVWKEIENEKKVYKQIIDEIPDDFYSEQINMEISKCQFKLPDDHTLFQKKSWVVRNYEDIKKYGFKNLYNIFKYKNYTNFLVVPIFVENKMWGFIYLDRLFIEDGTQSITQEDQELLKNFLRQTEESLQNFYNRRRSNVLAQLGHKINSVLKYKNLRDSLIEVVEQAFDTNKCTFFKVEENKIIGINEKLTKYEFDFEEGFIGSIVQNKTNLRTEIIRVTEDRYMDSKEEVEWKITNYIPDKYPYFLGIPIIIDNDVEGAICIRREKSSPFFTCYDEDLLMEIGTLTAIGIKKIKLLEQKTAWLKVIHDTIKFNLLSTQEDLDEVLKEIYKRSIDISNADYGQLFIYNEKENILEVQQSKEWDKKRLNLNQGIVGKFCASNLEIINISDISNDSRNGDYIAPIKKSNCMSELAIPIIYEEEDKKQKELIGVINLESKHKNAFSKDIEEMLETLANSAGIAIVNARLKEELKRKIASVERHYQVAEEVISQRPLEEIYNNIVEHALELLSKDSNQPERKMGVDILFPDESKNALIVKSAAGDTKKTSIDNKNVDLYHPENKKKLTVTGYVYTNRRAVNVGNISNLKNIKYYDSILFDFNTISELSVPIKYGDKVLGVLNAEADKEYAFTKEDEEVLEFFASQVGLAIQAKRVFERMNDFLGSIAHKLRNHFHTFSSSIQILSKKHQIEQDMAEDLLTEIETYKLDIENLSMLSRIDSYKLDWKAEEIELKELINKISKSYKKSLEKKKLSFNIHIVSDISMFIPQNPFVSILDNLISNAINYSYNNTEIKIKAKMHNKSVKIRINNKGVGIKQKDKERVFDKYYSVIPGADIERIGPASGLGLYIVRNLVNRLNGNIEVKSEVNKYAEFIVTLPLYWKGE